MKLTYENRLRMLEAQGQKGNMAWVNAKRFVDVMTKFELVEQDK